MVLRQFARVSIQVERLWKQGKTMIFLGVFCLAFFTALLATWHAYARVMANASPVAWNRADVYVEMRSFDLHTGTDYLIAQLLGISLEKTDYYLHLAQQTGAQRLGAYRTGDQVTFFAQDQLLGPDSVPLPALTFSERIKTAWKRYQFAKLAENQAVSVALRQQTTWFYGGIEQNQPEIELRLAKSVRSLKNPLQTKEIQANSLFFQFDGRSGMAPAPFSSLPEAWFHYPGALTLRKGNVQRLLKNPYDTEISWSLESRMPMEAAQNLLNEHIDRLSQAYPLVEERALPDGTTVSELQLSRDQFLLPDQVTELAVQPNGALTYPRGQLTYEYKDGVFSIRKLTEDGEDQPSAHQTCLIPDATTYGTADETSSDDFTWSRISFSLTSDELAICILPE